MGRLRNSKTGVVVAVRDDKETSLGLGWEPVKGEAQGEQDKPAPRRTRKKSE